LIVRHHLGFVLANAGIDSSNVPGATRDEMVLLLPRDPDASARSLRERLVERFGVELAVIISDSFGRPWRRGVVNVAIGTAGLQSLIDRRGELDREGRMLEGTEVAIADAAAAATGLAMGEAAESCPAALLRGLNLGEAAGSAQDLLRPLEQDLFQ
jgi:coenzyme F420-0:L-glutamate ligase/coenzyme F420-1:gamma-L-glutamate ligase